MILEHFDEYLPKFKKIIPNDYKKMLVLSKHYEEMGLGSEQAPDRSIFMRVQDRKRWEGTSSDGKTDRIFRI